MIISSSNENRNKVKETKKQQQHAITKLLESQLQNQMLHTVEQHCIDVEGPIFLGL
jgi:hypothetical protein